MALCGGVHGVSLASGMRMRRVVYTCTPPAVSIARFRDIKLYDDVILKF